MQATKYSFYFITVKHYSIYLWESGRLLEVKNNRKIEITSVESGHVTLRYGCLQEVGLLMI